MSRPFFNPNAQPTVDYYNRRESRVGYQLVVGGTKHYGYYPPGVRLSMSAAQRMMESMLGARLNLPQGARVLDAGCGEGYVALHLAQEFGYEAQGIDLLGWSISKAKANQQSMGVKNAAFRIGDYSHTGFPDNYFDAVYTMETLVHSPDYAATLKEFYRILKPGGVLVNQEYVCADHLPKTAEDDLRFIFQDCPMPTFDSFRESRMRAIWSQAGFADATITDATGRVQPFMKRFYQLAFVPFHLLKLFGRQKRYVNIYAAVRSYQLRGLLRYMIVRSQKPRSTAR